MSESFEHKNAQRKICIYILQIVNKCLSTLVSAVYAHMFNSNCTPNLHSVCWRTRSTVRMQIYTHPEVRRTFGRHECTIQTNARFIAHRRCTLYKCITYATVEHRRTRKHERRGEEKKTQTHTLIYLCACVPVCKHFSQIVHATSSLSNVLWTWI